MKLCLNMRPQLYCASLASFAFLTAGLAAAQTAPDGFSTVETPMGQAYFSPTHPDIRLLIRPLPAAHNPQEARDALIALKSEFQQTGLCSEILDDVPASVMDGQITVLEDPAPTSLCGGISVTGMSGIVVSLASNPTADTQKQDAAGRLAMAVLIAHNQSSLTRDLSTQPVPTPIIPDRTPPTSARPREVVSQVSPQTDSGSEARLKAAIAQVKAENKPVLVYTKLQGQFLGFPATFQYIAEFHMLFANGYGTDCADWDPRRLDPTPQSLGRANDNCDLYRWRKTAAGAYETQDEDGVWEVAYTSKAEDETPFGFSPGTRINIDFSSVDSYSSAPGSGMVSVTSIGYNGLKMTSDGFIKSDREASTSFSGSGVAGGSAGSTVYLTGRYRLDGNLFAVETPNQEISVGYIAGLNGEDEQTLKYVYFQGELLWK